MRLEVVMGYIKDYRNNPLDERDGTDRSFEDDRHNSTSNWLDVSHERRHVDSRYDGFEDNYKKNEQEVFYRSFTERQGLFEDVLPWAGQGLKFFFFIILLIVHVFLKDAEQTSPSAQRRGNRTLRYESKSHQLFATTSDEQLLAIMQTRPTINQQLDYSQFDPKKAQLKLSLAAEHSRVLTAEFLVSQPIDVNWRNSSGDTPLHIAVKNRSKQIVDLLVANGADPLAVNDSGFGIIHRASEAGYYDVVNLALEAGQNASAQALTWTPLHFACRNGHFEIVKLLVRNGADTNTTINQGWTPGDLAVKRHPEIARYLLRRGARFRSDTSSIWD